MSADCVTLRLRRPSTSQDVKRLIRSMVERDPKKRIKMEEICQQPWVAQASFHVYSLSQAPTALAT